jgi:hypothetical protein
MSEQSMARRLGCLCHGGEDHGDHGRCPGALVIRRGGRPGDSCALDVPAGKDVSYFTGTEEELDLITYDGGAAVGPWTAEGSGQPFGRSQPVHRKTKDRDTQT